MSKRQRVRVSRIGALLWAGREMERQMADPWRGYCPGCDKLKLTSECQRVTWADDGYSVYVCRTCGDLIDESPPF